MRAVSFNVLDSASLRQRIRLQKDVCWLEKVGRNLSGLVGGWGRGGSGQTLLRWASEGKDAEQERNGGVDFDGSPYSVTVT